VQRPGAAGEEQRHRERGAHREHQVAAGQEHQPVHTGQLSRRAAGQVGRDRRRERTPEREPEHADQVDRERDRHLHGEPQILLRRHDVRHPQRPHAQPRRDQRQHQRQLVRQTLREEPVPASQYGSTGPNGTCSTSSFNPSRSGARPAIDSPATGPMWS
jgi:hypothetical protein